MGSETFQYRALFEYKREHTNDISLQPGDLLTVAKASLMSAEPPEGGERSPPGWLPGVNERSKEKGLFPRTFVEFIGVVAKPWPRPGPPDTEGQLGAAASSGAEAELLLAAAPVVAQRLIEAIEKHGVNGEPLYQRSSSNSGPIALRQVLDSDPISADLDKYDVVSLSDALRGFLQDLHTPIIPPIVYNEVVYTAQENQTVEECGEKLRSILESPNMPQANHQLLVRLSRHWDRVSQQGQASPRLLAQAFADVVFKQTPLRTDVNPELHLQMFEALITTGGLTEMQPAPGEAQPHLPLLTARH